MKARNLISSFAAVLFTFASLSAVNYNVAPQQSADGSHAATVTDLAPSPSIPSPPNCAPPR